MIFKSMLSTLYRFHQLQSPAQVCFNIEAKPSTINCHCDSQRKLHNSFKKRKQRAPWLAHKTPSLYPWWATGRSRVNRLAAGCCTTSKLWKSVSYVKYGLEVGKAPTISPSRSRCVETLPQNFGVNTSLGFAYQTYIFDHMSSCLLVADMLRSV